jgi:hypothetical protein
MDDFYDETAKALFDASELTPVKLTRYFTKGYNTNLNIINNFDVIVFITPSKNMAYLITPAFRNAILNLNPNLSPKVVSIVEMFALKNKIKYFPVSYIELTNMTDIERNMNGGKKAVVKYTVKQLQAIASKNNIKITKKVDGKTVRLNKQGLIAKLKRYKVL